MKKNSWSKEELFFFKRFKKPTDIQKFLNLIPYDPDDVCRSPRYVIKELKAHCFEGALFAAASLRQLGYKPLIVDLRAVNDDDHVIAVFKNDNHWGAVAKSNFTTLRFREPVYRTIRELAMSYFDFYFNTIAQKSLREYSLPLDLSRFDKENWMTADEDLDHIGDCLDKVKHIRLITASMEKSLEKVDDMLFKAGLFGSDPSGLFKPER